MTASNALATRMITSAFGSGNPANLEVRLFTTMPDPRTGSGGQVLNFGGYSNATIANDLENFPPPTSSPSGVVQTVAAAIDFGTPTEPWSGVIGIGFYASGSLWYSLEMDSPQSFVTGRAVFIEANTIELTLDPEE